MIKYTNAPELTKNTEFLIVPVLEEKGLDAWTKKLDQEYGGLLSKAIDTEEFESKKLQTVLLFTSNEKTTYILLVGLGEKKNLNIETWKRVVGVGVIAAQSKKQTKLGLYVSSKILKVFDSKHLAQETVVAVETANYAFDNYKEEKAKVKSIESFELLGSFSSSEQKAIEKGISDGQVIGQSVNTARTLGNTSPSEMFPEQLAKEAEKIAKVVPGLKTKVLNQTEIEKLKMGSFLGVASGSQHEPKFIIMEYWGAAKSQKPTVLVGKGITFDSGGLSIKTGNYMCDMKFDMLGAATAIATIAAAARLKLKKNIITLAPTCENMPGGDAYRPDDILTAMNGKTIEVKNTDAEGRLILADALCYASKYQPKEVIDFATLTGSCMAALGLERNGLFSPEQKIADKILESSKAVGEQHWQLPLGEEYSESMKSEIADISNISSIRYGGASTAAAFLQFFTDYAWAHIDLSASYHKGKGKPWIRHGANGSAVQTMVEYLR